MDLQRTWITAKDRYVPYGMSGSCTAWDAVDWAQVQNHCLLDNLHSSVSLVSVPLLSSSRMLSLPSAKDGDRWLRGRRVKPRPKLTTSRTAIILRGWDTLEFTEQDLWSVRSLISETSLATGGRYTVIYLVDVQNSNDILRNNTKYEETLSKIPAELRNMTVLFDQLGTLEAWYPKIPSHL